MLFLGLLVAEPKARSGSRLCCSKPVSAGEAQPQFWGALGGLGSAKQCGPPWELMCSHFRLAVSLEHGGP